MDETGAQTTRRIIHVDMDAFYASIEQRDDPQAFADRPVAVGGSPPRGVVMSASYEARPDGVTSAMPAAEAKRKCPDLVFVSPRMQVYKEEGRRIRSILREYTDLVEPVSLDEAYLDVTEPKKGPPSGTLVAREIRRRIREETGLTASAGVSSGKFLAKVASDYDKPDGLTVVPPSEAKAFLRGLPIDTFHGVGPATAQKMRSLGIEDGADLQQADRHLLHRHFGGRGLFFHRMAHGNDRRPVNPNRERKSIGAEKTFTPATQDLEALIDHLDRVLERLLQRVTERTLEGREVTLKIKHADFSVHTRQHTLSHPTGQPDALRHLGRHLLTTPHPPREPVRLLGLSLSRLTERAEATATQLWLPFEGFSNPTPASSRSDSV
jgi:DNA polymerase-4